MTPRDVTITAKVGRLTMEFDTFECSDDTFGLTWARPSQFESDLMPLLAQAHDMDVVLNFHPFDRHSFTYALRTEDHEFGETGGDTTVTLKARAR